MKIMNMIIPDLHGRYEMLTNVDSFLSENEGKAIFMGDIFDSFDRSSQDQIKCFDILKQLKEKWGDRFIWLLGNHDTHYIWIDNISTRGGGFYRDKAFIYQQMLISVQDMLQFFYIEGNTIYSHAGITNEFINYNNIIEDVNDLMYYNNIKNYLPWTLYCGPEKKGTDLFSGPVWCGMNFLIKNHIPNYNQVLGHTYCEKPELYEVNGVKLLFTDCHFAFVNDKF